MESLTAERQEMVTTLMAVAGIEDFEFARDVLQGNCWQLETSVNAYMMMVGEEDMVDHKSKPFGNHELANEASFASNSVGTCQDCEKEGQEGRVDENDGLFYCLACWDACDGEEEDIKQMDAGQQHLHPLQQSPIPANERGPTQKHSDLLEKRKKHGGENSSDAKALAKAVACPNLPPTQRIKSLQKTLPSRGMQQAPPRALHAQQVQQASSPHLAQSSVARPVGCTPSGGVGVQPSAQSAQLAQPAQPRFSSGCRETGSGFVLCQNCHECVTTLGDVRLVTNKTLSDTPLVAELSQLGKSVLLTRPHHDGMQFPYKKGKLTCICGENLGNIQNNIAVKSYRGADVGLLKFQGICFSVSTSPGLAFKIPAARELRPLEARLRQMTAYEVTPADVLHASTGSTKLKINPMSGRPVEFTANPDDVAASRRDIDMRVTDISGTSRDPPASIPSSLVAFCRKKNGHEKQNNTNDTMISGQKMAATHAGRVEAEKAPPLLPKLSHQVERTGLGSSARQNDADQIRPQDKELMTATVTKVLKTERALFVGFCRRDHIAGSAGKDGNASTSRVEDLFFFVDAVECGGLQLTKGDTLGYHRMDLSPGQKDGKLKLARATLLRVLPTKCLQRMEEYLIAMSEALDDDSRRDDALACLCQRHACETVWNCISDVAVGSRSEEVVVQTLALLAKHVTHASSSVQRTAKRALETVLLTNISLPPPSLFGRVMQRDRTSAFDSKLRDTLVGVLCEAWTACDRQLHRRIFKLLRDVVLNHPSECVRLLPPLVLIQLLGSTLTHGQDLLASYHWRDLPLYVLPSEIRSSDGDAGALLRCVKKGGGSYGTFEEYMETYVGLLRENAFANMRNGLCDLRKGKLDSRDMRVFTSVRLVAMSPPSSNARAEGTVVELQTSGSVREQVPMFGSLLALAPHGNFEDAVWATVAGAEAVKGSLKIYAELCAGPCRDSSQSNSLDSSVVARLLRDAGEMSVAESPSFYRAYAPALSALQTLQEDHMQFFSEIVLGEDASVSEQPSLSGILVDGSIAFKADDPSWDAALAKMNALEFIRALDHFSVDGRGTSQFFDGIPLKCTSLDASQCQALKSALLRRITMIQGPPGCGKTFVGVRVARLLSSMTSEDHLPNLSLPPLPNLHPACVGSGDDSSSKHGPILVFTYKNVALDDFLLDCLKIWPAGVARVGGRPQAGSPLEHRHMNELLRDARSHRSQEHANVCKAVEGKRNSVEDAARQLSESRFFSPRTLAERNATEHARALLRRLVLSDDTDSEEERSSSVAAIESQDPSIVLSRAEKTITRWLPSQKTVSEFCQLPSSQGSDTAAVVFPNTHTEPAEELDERARDRSRYLSFEKTTVSLQRPTASNERLVLQLKDPITDIDRYRILNTENVRTMEKIDRVRLMHMLVEMQFDAALQVYDRSMQDYVQIVDDLRRHETKMQVDLLRRMKVVGMTISGAAIMRDLIQQLQPSSVLIEEAAEVLEPLLVASLGKWVQRLILIGDNEQLPPQVESYSLARDQKFDTSLMHRLIANKLPFVALTSQSRMMPEFAELLRDVYPRLTTSVRVDVAQRLSPPPGFKTSMWFWNVDAAEEIDPARRSHMNKTEADAVVALVIHLLRSGVKPQQITVLAPYTAQVELIRKKVQEAERKECEATWPKPEVQGAAALKKLEAFRRAHSSLFDFVEVADTLLQLGKLDDAFKAIDVAHKSLTAPSASAAAVALTSAPAAAALLPVIQKYRERRDKMMKIREDVLQNIANEDPQAAMQNVKSLQSLASQWMVDGIPFVAAACHLRSELAEQVISLFPRLPEKQRVFLKGLKNSAETLLLDLRSRDSVCVSSIDRFQGSENDIVIISLVRTEGVGFLKERARRVVAQSRARLGMYFVGHSLNYSRMPHWKILIGAMHKCNRVGDKIQLCCANALHSCTFDVAVKDAAGVIKNNLCRKPCKMLMGCGVHKCKLPCHGSGVDRHHAAMCVEMVDDKCKGGHAIRRKCNVSAQDAVCMTCERIAAQEREIEEQLREQREKDAKEECERLILELKRNPRTLNRRELKRHGADCVEFFQVMDRTEKYVQIAHKHVFVARIEKITNLPLEVEFLQAKQKLLSGAADCNMQQLFHGTGRDGVEGISSMGFHLPATSEENMFGRGVYFATDSSKSAQEMYTKGSNCLLLCDVLLGKSCMVEGLDSKHPLSEYVKRSRKRRPYLDVDEAAMHKSGFDSVFAPRGTRGKSGVQFDEMIVYNPSQALPRYIIHFGDKQAEWSLPVEAHCGCTVRKLKRDDPLLSEVSKECEEFNMACAQFLRLLGSEAEVLEVDIYDSRAVQARYMAKIDEFQEAKKPTKEVWVFHGTSPENIENICRDGFKIGGQGVPIVNGAAYGRGVYTATGPNTPVQYAKKGGSIILCKSLPGVTKGSTETDGGDSWKPSSSDWMIFKTVEQLLPNLRPHTLADSIKPLVERKDVEGKDTFDMSDWCKANYSKLPAFTYVLRAVLTNSPNSCPPESLFRIFNSTFEDDQKSSYADHMQLSMQSQFNKRPLQ